MVRLDDRLAQIKKTMVDREKYFVINRGRQYGKTTTIRALGEYLKEDYTVLPLDFQLMGTKEFADEEIFAHSFADDILKILQGMDNADGEKLAEALLEMVSGSSRFGLKELFLGLSNMCRYSRHPIVLMIDEVDSASNNQVFIDFLARLRAYYLGRDDTPIFHSVILAGVYDIKNLKLKLRHEMEHQYNSPWNIAADFDIEMSFSADQTASMLEEYEADYHTGMDVHAVSEEIYEYTSGYPVLVSAICKRIDEKILGKSGFEKPQTAWSKEGIEEAVKMILAENAPLFESMIRQLHEHPELKQMLNAVLFQGKRITFNTDNPVIHLAAMFGYICSVNGSIRVANRIFETRLYNYFLSEEELTNAMYDKAQGNKGIYFQDGRLDMDLVLEKFVQHFTEIYGNNDDKFVEDYGRKFFLLYLKPIINGTGNYYIEAQTRDARRTDVIVDYLGEQFIVELKIWHGNEYNERGEAQLADYLEYYHKNKGYLLSFNFNKNKKTGINEIRIGNKTIVEAVV